MVFLKCYYEICHRQLILDANTLFAQEITRKFQQKRLVFLFFNIGTNLMKGQSCTDQYSAALVKPELNVQANRILILHLYNLGIYFLA